VGFFNRRLTQICADFFGGEDEAFVLQRRSAEVYEDGMGKLGNSKIVQDLRVFGFADGLLRFAFDQDVAETNKVRLIHAWEDAAFIGHGQGLFAFEADLP
jgi:hypothetical protein